jgi:hypothetical protein
MLGRVCENFFILANKWQSNIAGEKYLSKITHVFMGIY